MFLAYDYGPDYACSCALRDQYQIVKAVVRNFCVVVQEHNVVCSVAPPKRVMDGHVVSAGEAKVFFVADENHAGGEAVALRAFSASGSPPASAVSRE